MNEEERLKELIAHHIMDTLPEKDFDDIVKMAAEILEAPIALISFLDSDRQWYKAKVGTEQNEIPREESICKHTILHPSEILVINDTLTDERSKDLPSVLGESGIRFYAGSPITSESGHVLGTLCINDHVPRLVTDLERRTLKALAARVMKLVEERYKAINHEIAIVKSEDLIEKISDHSPGALFKFQITNEGEMSFPFVSKGISLIHPGLTPEMLKNNAALGFNTIHPDDLPKVYESIGNSYKTLTDLDFEFRIATDDGVVKWHRAKANPEKREDAVVWYGTLQDITQTKEYIATLEEIMFSISHIIRKPVTTLMGLVELLNDESLTQEKMKGLTAYFNKVASEMDEYTQKLNNVFHEKKIRATTNQMM